MWTPNSPAQFELIARPKASLDAAIGKARDAGYEVVDLGADLEGEARSVAADGGEALLREALSKASREVIEKIAWEVVPELAETIIREELERLMKERGG